MRIQISIDAKQLKGTLDQIRQDIGTAMKRTVNAINPGMNSFAQDKSKEAIYQSKEMNNLLSGRLRNEFGVEDTQSAVQQIVDILTRQLTVRLESKIVNNEFELTYTADFLREIDSFVDMSRGTYNTYKKTDMSYGNADAEVENEIPWMKWWLEEGSATLIEYYYYKHVSRATSRTGTGIMVRSSKFDWGVPAETQGTKLDNAITRALEPVPAIVGDEYVRRFNQQFRL